MSPKNWARRLHCWVIKRRHDANESFFLSHAEFKFAADCERSRVDRNGSVLSILLLELPSLHQDEPDYQFLARVLEGRLRVTDTPGRLADGRIGILLPDTPREGAWKLAEDLCEVYSPGPTRPHCEVVVYPSSEDHHAGKRADEQSAPVGKGVTGSAESRSNFFFAKPYPRWKRALDVAGALAGLVISAPVLALSAILIKFTSPGPVLFFQTRAGYGGRPFRMSKLRTMVVGAEEMVDSLRHDSHQDGPAFKLRDDPRTTRLGRLLRWTSIDELPQFWDVLRGRMSLVGPRPLPVDESAACSNWQRRRLDVKPGMTCIWQVSSRGTVSFDDWVRMDLKYIEKTSAWQDLKLVMITLPSLLKQKGMR
jgi:lipopolysaccharide/colanic/teichoic acid biosynthesis glycosyltransferase